MLRGLKLKNGYNRIQFSVQSFQGIKTISAGIYLWPSNSKIVVSDVDGTITRSDVMGHLVPWIGGDWSHEGVAKFFSNVAEYGYQIVYLTSRAIGQADVTRSYLFNEIAQQTHAADIHVLPEGPVLMSPQSLLRAFHREVIARQPQKFKIPALQGVKFLFPQEYQCFHAGFGNRATDLISYLKVEMPKSRIFIIDPTGTMTTSHNQNIQKTYGDLNDSIDMIFPERHASVKIKQDYGSETAEPPAQLEDVDATPGATPAPEQDIPIDESAPRDQEETYTSFNYWRSSTTKIAAVDLPEL